MNRTFDEMEGQLDNLFDDGNPSTKRLKLALGTLDSESITSSNKDGGESMSISLRPQAPFPFLSLPHELRDGIYDAAMIDNSPFRLYQKRERPEDTMNEVFNDLTNLVQVYRDDSNNAADGQAVGSEDSQQPPAPVALGLTASIRNAPMTSLMLASKEINKDYGKRVQRAKELVLKDSENYAFLPVHLPEYAKDVWHATLKLILFCTCAPMSIQHQFKLYCRQRVWHPPCDTSPTHQPHFQNPNR